MNTKVNKTWLENRIAEINRWLAENPNHEMARVKKNDLMYYAQKVQELEETTSYTWKYGQSQNNRLHRSPAARRHRKGINGMGTTAGLAVQGGS